MSSHVSHSPYTASGPYPAGSEYVTAYGTLLEAFEWPRPLLVEDAESPGFVRREALEGYDARRIVRDLVVGTRAVHKYRARYLPPWEGEAPTDYLQRATHTECYGATSRALEAAVGMVYAQPPALESGDDLASELLADAFDIDGRGNSFDAATRHAFTNYLADGFALILVDFPAWPDGMPRTRAAAERLERRPRWRFFSADQVVNWRTEEVDGAEALTLLVLRYWAEEPTGTYGVTTGVRYLVLRLEGRPGARAATWAVHDLGDDGTTVNRTPSSSGRFVGADGVPFERIPVAEAYASKPRARLFADSPLAKLAELNLGHYRVSASRRWGMTWHFSPPLLLTGRKPRADGTYPPIRVGAGATIDVPTGGAGAYLNPSADAFAPSGDDLQRLAAEMASVSLAFLSRRDRSSETAEARRIEATAGNASLASAVTGWRDALSTAWAFHARYRGVEAPNVTARVTYDARSLDGATISALSAIVRDRLLSHRTFLATLRERGTLPAGFDIDEEFETIREETLEAVVEGLELEDGDEGAGEGPDAPPAPDRDDEARADAGDDPRVGTGG